MDTICHDFHMKNFNKYVVFKISLLMDSGIIHVFVRLKKSVILSRIKFNKNVQSIHQSFHVDPIQIEVDLQLTCTGHSRVGLDRNRCGRQ